MTKKKKGVKKWESEEDNKELARQLRMVADMIEADGYPRVYAATMFPEGRQDLPSFLAEISVVMSYPWPG